jgi:hypothetical protein
MTTNKKTEVEHYYGDTVRQLFFAAAAVMAALLPFVNDKLGFPIPLSISGILILIVAAGLTKPKRSYTALLNGVIAFFSAGLFEYYAVIAYNKFTGSEGAVFLLLFLANQILTIIFIFALYLSVKTIRGLFDKNINGQS